jgi:hypothetical protein
LDLLANGKFKKCRVNHVSEIINRLKVERDAQEMRSSRSRPKSTRLSDRAQEPGGQLLDLTRPAMAAASGVAANV